MMDQRIKSDWIAALESGEYKQGTGMLRTTQNEFCCLGVLCDLYAKETGTKWTTGLLQYNYLESGAVLPVAVQHWAGLDDDIGTYRSADLNGTALTAVNDRGATFPEIVELIKAHF